MATVKLTDKQLTDNVDDSMSVIITKEEEITGEKQNVLYRAKIETIAAEYPAKVDEEQDLTKYGFALKSDGRYSIETDTSSNPVGQHDISFMQAGDSVKVVFTIDGGGYVYINDDVYDTTSGVSFGQVTWEGVLTKPIRAVTGLCVIYMQVIKKATPGFMSGADKVKLEQISNMLVPLMISAYGMRKAFSIYVKNNLEKATLTELTEQFFKSAATTVNETYTSQFYLFDVSNTPDGTKLADNAGLVCEPSTNTAANRDDYADLPLFACFDVNYTIDETTLEPVIHEIKGITDGFTSSPTYTFVGVLQMTGWVRRTVTDTQKTVEYRAQKAAGYKPLPEAVRASDNSVRPYVIHAKYAAGYNTAGKLSSVSGVQPVTYRPGSENSYNICRNAQINLFRTIGNQYAGFNYCDISFLQLMFEIKYAKLGSADVMEGCRAYNYNFTAAVSESNVKRIILSKTNGENFVVGSRASIGTSNSRSNAACYDICDVSTIQSIENLSIDDTEYIAINLKTDSNFNTTANTTYIITQPWSTGSTDKVQGNDGSPTDNTSGKEPFKLQGIEIMLGASEVYSDIIYSDDTQGYTVYANRKAADIVSADSGNNAVNLGTIAKEQTAGQKFISELNWQATEQEAYIIPKQLDGSSSTGYQAAIYREAMSGTGWRQWITLGSLDLQSAAGLAFSRVSYGASVGNWYISTRICGTSGNRGNYVGD